MTALGQRRNGSGERPSRRQDPAGQGRDTTVFPPGFELPDTRVPLRFTEGEHRLVGRVEPPGPPLAP